MKTLVLACFASVIFAAPILAQNKRIPVILDTDVGDDIDDAFAVALALKSPELDIVGITTAFEDAHTRALLLCRWFETMNLDKPPIISGRGRRDKPVSKEQMGYGLKEGIKKKPADVLAVEFMLSQFKARPGEITLLTVGPLTNVADLLNKHPECKKWIPRIVMMGGSVHIGYDAKKQPAAEWNIKADIPAAKVVFDSGIPLVVAPLDATGHLVLTKEMRQKIFDIGQPLHSGLKDLYALWKRPDPILFDPVAVRLAFDESLCKMESMRLTVDDKGFTRIAQGPANARVAVDIDRDAFMKWFVERLTK